MLEPSVQAATDSAVSAANSLANTVSQQKANDENYKRQKKESELAFQRGIQMWEMQNEYNTPTNFMKRYADAGLNPNLIYGKATASNSALPQYQKANAQIKAPQVDLSRATDAIYKYQDLRLRAAQADNVRAQTEESAARKIVAEKQAEKLDTEISANTISLPYISAEKGTKIANTQADSRIKETTQQAMQVGMDKTNEEIKLIQYKQKGQQIANAIQNTIRKYSDTIQGNKAAREALETSFYHKAMKKDLTLKDIQIQRQRIAEAIDIYRGRMAKVDVTMKEKYREAIVFLQALSGSFGMSAKIATSVK